MSQPFAVFRFDTDTAALAVRVRFPADYLRILEVPTLANLRVRIGGPDGPELRQSDSIREFSSCERWEDLFLSWDAVAGGEIAIMVGTGVRGRRDDDGVEIREKPSAEIVAGSKSVPDSGSGAEAIAADVPCREVLVQASSDNTDTVMIGSDADQPVELAPGAAIGIAVDNVGRLYVVSPTAGQTVGYLARS